MLETVEVRTPAEEPLIRYAYDYTNTVPARLASSEVDYVNTALLGDTVDGTNVGVPTTYEYDAEGRLSRIEDARENAATSLGEGGTTTVAYDAGGKVASLSRELDTADPVTGYTEATTSYVYSADTSGTTRCNDQGQSRTVVDGERLPGDVDDTTTYCADTHGGVVRVVDAKDHLRKSTYTAISNVETADMSGLESGGQTFQMSYDSNDNPTSTTTPTGGTASAQYDDSANPHFPTSMRDFDTGGSTSAAATWEYDYDDKGNLIEARAPLTSGKTITYRYCWDGAGQLQRVDPPDANGNSSVSKDEDVHAGCGYADQGNDTLHTYDTDANLTQVDAPGPNRTQTYTYDALSRVQTVTDGRGVRTSFTYDALDRVVAQTYEEDPTDTIPDGQFPIANVTYTYDQAGNLTALDDPTGHQEYGYDELNRRVFESAQAPSGNKSYNYDQAGNLTRISVSDEPAPTLYTYDAVNLVTSVDDQRSGTNTVTFDHDRHDKRTKTTYPMPDGNHVIQAARYGDGGQLKCTYSHRLNTAPANGEDACPSPSFDGLITYHGYDYTAPGSFDTNTRYRLTELGGVTTDYDYDKITRLTAATTKSSTGTQLRKFGYDYDRHSNLLEEVVTGGTPGLNTGILTMAYTDADELCWSATSGTPTPDCGAAPTGATSYAYDGAGSLTGGSNGLNLDYNVLGQTSSIDPAGATPAIPMAYQGSTQDRRTSAGSTAMTYGFSGLSAQSTTSAIPHAEWFVRDPGGKLVAMVDRDNTEPDLYYLMDGQDSVVATIDTNGKVRRYLYEPYGEQIRTWIDTNAGGTQPTDGIPPDGSEDPYATPNPSASDYNPWRYASGYYDRDTGMLKFGTRYYRPGLARWTQVDPMPGRVANPTTMNGYAYVSCNPINASDPTGRFSECTTESLWFLGSTSLVLYGVAVAPSPLTGAGLVFWGHEAENYSDYLWEECSPDGELPNLEPGGRSYNPYY